MSADFSRYVDLTLYDSDPGALYRSTVDAARLVLPEFTLRQGTVEDAIFQSFAFSSSIIVNAINRLPSRLMEGLVSMVGYERSVGTRSSAVLAVTLYGYEGTTIPTGTQFRYRYVEPGTSSFEDYVFETIEDTAIASTTSPTVPSANISVQCTQAGQIPALIAGDILLPLSIDTDINAVTVVSFINGVEPMGDGEYLSAALTYLESLTEVFATANQLQNAILTTFTNVRRCKVYDVTNSLASTSTSATAAPGYVAIYAYGNGAVLTNTELSEIQTWAANRCIAGLVITVSNFILSSPTVAINAVINSRYTASDVVDEIKSMIALYNSYENFPETELSVASPQIRANSIASVVAQTPEVLYVNSVTLTPPAAVAITEIRTGRALNGTTATGYVRFTASNSFVAGQEVDIVTNINTISITEVKPNRNLADNADAFGTLRFTTVTNSLTVGDIVTIDCGGTGFDFTRAVVTGANSSAFTISSAATGATTTGTAFYDFGNSIVYAANATHFVIANTCIADDAIFGKLLQGTTTFTAYGASVTAAGTYTGVTGTSSGSGTGAVFTIVKTGSGLLYSGAITVTITSGGSGYAVGDTITLSGANLGGGGDLTLTVGTQVNIKTGSAYLHFDGANSTSTTSLVFKNKGFLPNISSSGVTVTYSLEAV